MKRILSGLLAAGMLLSFGGCGRKPVQQASESSTEPEYSLQVYSSEKGKPATQPADTIPVITETVTSVVTVTSIVTVTSLVTVTEPVTADTTYDAGTLTESDTPVTVAVVPLPLTVATLVLLEV